MGDGCHLENRKIVIFDDDPRDSLSTSVVRRLGIEKLIFYQSLHL